MPEGDYVKSWSEFHFLPGALDAIRILAGMAPRLIVVSNQRGIAQGIMSEQDLVDIHENMMSEIRQAGGRIDSIYHCPHKKQSCKCRKPETGLFVKAQQEFPEIDFGRAVVVGDSLADLDAAVPAVVHAGAADNAHGVAQRSRGGPPAAIPRSGGSLVAAGL